MRFRQAGYGDSNLWDCACFEPATIIAVAGVAATVLGAGVSYMAANKAAASQSNMDNYNAQIATNNQKIADQAALDAQARGEVAATQKAFATQQLIGRQKAGLAANGVDVNSGSALALQADSAAAGELDELTIKNNAAREAVGFKNQGINYQNQATLDEQASQDVLAGGALKADASLIGGVGQVASQWYNFKYGTKTAGPGSLSA